MEPEDWKEIREITRRMMEQSIDDVYDMLKKRRGETWGKTFHITPSLGMLAAELFSARWGLLMTEAKDEQQADGLRALGWPF